MTPKRLLVAAGAVAGSLGISLGVGLTVAHAASGSTTATTPPAPASGSMPNGYCPNMGGSSNSSTSNGV
jgi:hypothetical protein